MTRIDFYQIESDESPLDFCCRLIGKIFQGGHDIYIHTETETLARELDELLWRLPQNRFLPHCLLVRQDGEDDAPIHIGFEDDPGKHQDVLVNLSGKVPHFFSRFTRVTEVVPRDEASRQAARDTYKFYQDRGYPLEYHRISR